MKSFRALSKALLYAGESTSEHDLKRWLDLVDRAWPSFTSTWESLDFHAVMFDHVGALVCVERITAERLLYEHKYEVTRFESRVISKELGGAVQGLRATRAGQRLPQTLELFLPKEEFTVRRARNLGRMGYGTHLAFRIQEAQLFSASQELERQGYVPRVSGYNREERCCVVFFDGPAGRAELIYKG